MSVFDISSITSTGSSALQSAASTVATSLAPKHHAPRAHAEAGSSPSAVHTQASSTGAATNATGGSTITSNDFLTLLVSELKNQDPTQPTDPNAYITQLVGVNSLQQLISINQGVNKTGSGSSAAPTPPPSGH